MRRSVDFRESAVGQRVQRRLVGALPRPAFYSALMQFFVDLGRGCIRRFPCMLEGVEAFPTALRARSVASREGHGFIQKEQFRITAWRHDGSMPAPKLQNARNPTLVLERTHDLLPIVVQCASAVTHKGPAGGRTEDRAIRVNAVL